MSKSEYPCSANIAMVGLFGLWFIYTIHTLLGIDQRMVFKADYSVPFTSEMKKSISLGHACFNSDLRGRHGTCIIGAHLFIISPLLFHE